MTVFITGKLREEIIYMEAGGETERRIFDTEEFRMESKASYTCTMDCHVVEGKTPLFLCAISFY